MRVLAGVVEVVVLLAGVLVTCWQLCQALAR